MKPCIFRQRRDWRNLGWGLAAIPLSFGAVLTVLEDDGFWLTTLLTRMFGTLGLLISLAGGSLLLHRFLRPTAIITLTAAGIRGSWNLSGVYLLRWEEVASLKLETANGKTVIGVRPTWEADFFRRVPCSAAQKRAVKTRLARRQSPLFLHCSAAAAPAQTILRTMEQSLTAWREEHPAP